MDQRTSMPNSFPNPLLNMNYYSPFKASRFPSFQFSSLSNAQVIMYSPISPILTQQDSGSVISNQVFTIPGFQNNSQEYLFQQPYAPSFYNINSQRSNESMQNLLRGPEFTPHQAHIQVYDPNKSIKALLKDIVHFTLQNFGIISAELFTIEIFKYRNNPDLMNIFEILKTKYASTLGKSKDELIIYVLGKALKHLKQKTRVEIKALTNQDLSYLKKRKFLNFLEEISRKMEEDERAKNKVPPSFQYVSEALDSQEFYSGLQEYFHSFFDKKVALENNKKINKLIQLIETSIGKKSIKDLKKYKRVPWPKIWIDDARKVAYELIYGNSQEKEVKVFKKEEENMKLEIDSLSIDSPKIEETLSS